MSSIPLVLYPGDYLCKGLSAELWNGFNWGAAHDPTWGNFIMRRLPYDYNTTQYAETDLNSSSGTVTKEESAPGSVILDSAAATVAYGEQIQYGGTTGAFAAPVAGRDYWFETLIKVTTITNIPSLFAGLSTINVAALSATGTVNGTNAIGINALDGDGHLDLAVKSSSTNGNKLDLRSVALVDGAYLKLGFRSRGVTNVVGSVNGQLKDSSTYISTTNIPTGVMVPTWAICNQHTSTASRSTMRVYWWALGWNDESKIAYT